MGQGRRLGQQKQRTPKVNVAAARYSRGAQRTANQRANERARLKESGFGESVIDAIADDATNDEIWEVLTGETAKQRNR